MIDPLEDRINDGWHDAETFCPRVDLVDELKLEVERLTRERDDASADCSHKAEVERLTAQNGLDTLSLTHAIGQSQKYLTERDAALALLRRWKTVGYPSTTKQWQVEADTDAFLESLS